MIKLEKVPSKFREPGTIEFDTKISEEEGKKGMQPLIGAVALVALKSGEQVTFNKITEPSARTGLSPQVSPGMRAVSIPVTETSGVGKLIKPNDRVDLIGVIDGGGGKENKVSRTLIQDVVVLAVGKYITNNVPRIVEIDGKKQKVRSIAEDVSFNSITIEVEPDQAQRIALILSNPENSISFSLRNNDDNARVQIPPSNVSDILGGDVTRSLRGLQQGGRK
jgi:pilus assembly protein CpaB